MLKLVIRVDLTTAAVLTFVFCHPPHLTTTVPARPEFVVLLTTEPVPTVGFYATLFVLCTFS